MGRDGCEVRTGGNADTCLPAVRDDEPLPLSRHFYNAPRLGEADDAADVRLCDVHQPHVHQVSELVACGLPLTRGDLHWRLTMKTSIAFQVIDLDWCLEKKKIELLPVADGLEAGFRG